MPSVDRSDSGENPSPRALPSSRRRGTSEVASGGAIRRGCRPGRRGGSAGRSGCRRCVPPLLGHGLHHPLPPLGSPQQVAHLPAQFRPLLLSGRLLLSRRSLLGTRPLLASARPRHGRVRAHTSPAQNLVGRLAVHRGVVLAADRAAPPDRRALLWCDRSHSATRRTDHGALDRHRDALVLERGYERLANPELGDDHGSTRDLPSSYSRPSVLRANISSGSTLRGRIFWSRANWITASSALRLRATPLGSGSSPTMARR